MRICFFGDSFTNGTGDDTSLGWVGRVCAAARQRGHDLTFYNLGIRRDTSADILRRWSEEASARLPAGCDPRLVFAFGNNDAAAEDGAAPRIAHAVTLENAKSILKRAISSAPTLMIGPVPKPDDPEWNGRIEALSSDLSSLCAAIGIPFLNLTLAPRDAWAAWQTEAGRGDGVHPNAQGYAALAAHVDSWAAWRSWFA